MKSLYMTPPNQQLNKIRTRTPSAFLNKSMETNSTKTLDKHFPCSYKLRIIDAWKMYVINKKIQQLY